MRRWLLPALLAVLALPSVVPMVEASFAVLGGQGDDWITLLADLGQGMAAVALAVIVLRVGDRSPGMPLWLLDRRVLARVRESDRA